MLKVFWNDCYFRNLPNFAVQKLTYNYCTKSRFFNPFSSFCLEIWKFLYTFVNWKSTEVSQVAFYRPRRGRMWITAGGMTEGNGTCGYWQILSYRPRRGRTGARLDAVRPLWGRFLPTIGCPQVPWPSVIPPAVIGKLAPFGDRSFHQRLLKVGPLRGPEVTCETWKRFFSRII